MNICLSSSCSFVRVGPVHHEAEVSHHDLHKRGRMEEDVKKRTIVNTFEELVEVKRPRKGATDGRTGPREHSSDSSGSESRDHPTGLLGRIESYSKEGVSGGHDNKREGSNDNFDSADDSMGSEGILGDEDAGGYPEMGFHGQSMSDVQSTLGGSSDVTGPMAKMMGPAPPDIDLSWVPKVDPDEASSLRLLSPTTLVLKTSKFGNMGMTSPAPIVKSANVRENARKIKRALISSKNRGVDDPDYLGELGAGTSGARLSHRTSGGVPKKEGRRKTKNN